MTSIGTFPDLLRSPSEASEENGNGSGSGNGMVNGSVNGTTKKKKPAKGWDGEKPNSALAIIPLSNMNGMSFLTLHPAMLIEVSET